MKMIAYNLIKLISDIFSLYDFHFNNHIPEVEIIFILLDTLINKLLKTSHRLITLITHITAFISHEIYLNPLNGTQLQYPTTIISWYLQSIIRFNDTIKSCVAAEEVDHQVDEEIVDASDGT